jgi:hypothetical protein
MENLKDNSNNKFICKLCGREFPSQESLDMHNEHKHGIKNVLTEKKEHFKVKNKKSGKKIILIAIIILLVILLGGYWLAIRENNMNYDNFAQCLSEKNATMYGACWCPHCKDEKSAFGASWQYVNYVECAVIENSQCIPDGKQTKQCQDANIEGYPTWVFNNGTRLGGFVSLNDLSKMTNCTLP